MDNEKLLKLIIYADRLTYASKVVESSVKGLINEQVIHIEDYTAQEKLTEALIDTNQNIQDISDIMQELGIIIND